MGQSLSNIGNESCSGRVCVGSIASPFIVVTGLSERVTGQSLCLFESASFQRVGICEILSLTRVVVLN